MVFILSIAKDLLKKRASKAALFFIDNKVFTTFCLLLLLLPSLHSLAQTKAVSIHPTFGMSFRSTAMNFFNFRAVERRDFTLPYNYEKNVQGIALDLGVQLDVLSIGLEYSPRFRFDYVHSNYDIALQEPLPDTKDFLLDHNVNIFFRRKIIYGTGFTIVNAGKGYWFENPVGFRRYHNIEFMTYNLFVGVPVKKHLCLEFKAQYIPENFPINRQDDYIMYSLKAYYTFKSSNKE